MSIKGITSVLMQNTFPSILCKTGLYCLPISNLYLRVIEEVAYQKATRTYLGMNVHRQSYWSEPPIPVDVMPYQKDYLLGMAIQALVTYILGKHLFSSSIPHSWMKWGCFGLLSLNLAISIPWHYVQEGGGVLFTPEESQG